MQRKPLRDTVPKGPPRPGNAPIRAHGGRNQWRLNSSYNHTEPASTAVKRSQKTSHSSKCLQISKSTAYRATEDSAATCSPTRKQPTNNGWSTMPAKTSRFLNKKCAKCGTTIPRKIRYWMHIVDRLNYCLPCHRHFHRQCPTPLNAAITDWEIKHGR